MNKISSISPSVLSQYFRYNHNSQSIDKHTFISHDNGKTSTHIIETVTYSKSGHIEQNYIPKIDLKT